MKLINTPYKIRCEMGACKNLADKTIVMDRVSIKNHLHVCGDCLHSLYKLIGEELIPKPVETLKMSKKRGGKNEQ
jgi:hypothetical protein